MQDVAAEIESGNYGIISADGKTTTTHTNNGTTSTKTTTTQYKTTTTTTDNATGVSHTETNLINSAENNQNTLNLYGLTVDQYNSYYSEWSSQRDKYTDEHKAWVDKYGTAKDKADVAAAEEAASESSFQSYLRDQKQYMENSRDNFLADDEYSALYADSLQYRTTAYDTAGAVTNFTAGTIQYQLDTASNKNVYSYPGYTTTATDTAETTETTTTNTGSFWDTFLNIFNSDYGTGAKSTLADSTADNSLSTLVKNTANATASFEKSQIENADSKMKAVIDYGESGDLISTNTLVSILPGYGSINYMYKSANGEELTGWDYAGLGFDAASFIGAGAKLGSTLTKAEIKALTKAGSTAENVAEAATKTGAKWVDDGADALTNAGDVSRGYRTVDDLTTYSKASKIAGAAALGIGAGTVATALVSNAVSTESDDSEITYTAQPVNTKEFTQETTGEAVYYAQPVNTKEFTQETTEDTGGGDNGTVTFDGQYSIDAGATGGGGGGSLVTISAEESGGSWLGDVVETVTETAKNYWPQILIGCAVIAAIIILSKNSKKKVKA